MAILELTQVYQFTLRETERAQVVRESQLGNLSVSPCRLNIKPVCSSVSLLLLYCVPVASPSATSVFSSVK